MAPFKAPGPDSYHAGFFQKSWSVVGDDLTKFVLEFMKFGILPDGCNNTILTLIPEISSPKTVKHLWPISLCNTTYKLITNVLTNRLKGAIQKLIGPHQSSFEPGRQIADNILVYQEVLNLMKSKRGSLGLMVLKIDLEKAYDRVTWAFIEETLQEAGFTQLDYNHNGLCYNVKISHQYQWEAVRLVQAKAGGIRQGDPISPLLFVFCMERLSHLISEKVNSGEWRGIQMARDGPWLPTYYSQTIWCCLEKQYPSKPESLNIALMLFVTLRANVYLGVPSLHGRLKQESFDGLIHRIRGKLDGWRMKTLSFAGRRTLAQSVLSDLRARGSAVSYLGKVVVQDKDAGGLGLRRPRSDELCPYSQTGMEVASRGRLLLDKNLRARYRIQSLDPATWQPRSSMSNAWRAILKVIPLLKEGTRSVVRNNMATLFWLDAWLGHRPLIEAVFAVLPLPDKLSAISLIDDDEQHDDLGWGDEKTGRAGCGGLGRNERGDWVAGFVHGIAYFESDSKRIVDAISQGAAVGNVASNVLHACKQELGKLSAWNLTFVPRDQNRVSDLLAKKGAGQKGTVILHYTPEDIGQLLKEYKVGVPI
ncbi:PREDICTED: uncharacterized protein LOC109151890 [Ipomoea nil]|uniref:uncharacterized protein LOC109151890 n=1 Tax=Ipomoea nil TaxID=35883 RepID=UPI00090155C9|nr:PREDICTED: uncharacterized protein LOC109151890 [Ipomoea nil]